MKNASKLEWLVLGSLADDEECVASIWPYLKEDIPGISGRRLKNTIYRLYERGLLYISGETARVSREDILAEDTTNKYSIGNYYFGLTATGAELFEEASKVYGEPVDWSSSWSGSYDFKRQEGYIEGTSLDVCFKALINDVQKNDGVFEEWQVDVNSLKISNVEKFQAKYYKYISGGHRISFKFKRR